MVLCWERTWKVGWDGFQWCACGSLPKLTRSWAITPSAVCDLWLMVYGHQPETYLSPPLPAWLIMVKLSRILLITVLKKFKMMQTTYCVCIRRHVTVILQQGDKKRLWTHNMGSSTHPAEVPLRPYQFLDPIHCEVPLQIINNTNDTCCACHL